MARSLTPDCKHNTEAVCHYCAPERYTFDGTYYHWIDLSWLETTEENRRIADARFIDRGGNVPSEYEDGQREAWRYE